MTPEVTPMENPNSAATEHVPHDQQTGFRKWLPLVVLALALAIIIIDTTILNVSLRTIINDLHTNIKSIQWVITAYALMLAAFTITGGRLGDLFGRKKTFMIGAVVFAIGSLLTAIAHSVGTIIVGNAIIEGIGACLMMPATASLLLANYRGRDRAIAFGVWGGIAAASAALGPIAGGWLTDNFSWRWAFLINIGVAAILILGATIIRESRDQKEKPELDITGIILSSLGLLTLVYGFIEASTYGWLHAKEQLVLFHHTLNLGNFSVTPIFVALGLVILVLFALWEKRVMSRGHTPLVSLNLFKNRQFLVGSLITSIMTIGMAGLTFSIPVFLQGVRNLSPFDTGLAMLPMPLAIFVSAPLSSFLVKFLKPKRMVQTALIIASTGFLILHYSLKVDATVWSLAPGFAIFGFGMGFMFAQLSNLTLSAVDVHEAGEASGVNNTFRQLGQSLGSAILGAILISSLGTNLVSGVNNSPVIPEPAKAAIAENMRRQSDSIEFGGQNASAANAPEFIVNEITNVVHQATTDASREVTIYGVAFLLLAFIISFGLENGPAGGHNPEKADDSPGAEAVVATEGSGSEETEPEEVDNRPEPITAQRGVSAGKAGALILAGVVVAGAAAGTAGYYYGKNKGVAPIVVQQNIQQPQVAGTAEWTPLFNPTVPPTSVDGGYASTANNATNSSSDQRVAGATTETPVAAVTYTDANVRFTMNMPADWKTVSKSSEVTINTPDHHAYSIQSYSTGSGQDDQAGLQAFLNRQSNLKNIEPTTFNGYKGYSFDVAGYYKKGYAILSGGRLYYILGTVLTDPELASFKTM